MTGDVGAIRDSLDSPQREFLDQIWAAFETTYLTAEHPVTLVGHPVITTAPETGEATVEAHVRLGGGERWLKGHGNGPIAAFVDALKDAGIVVELTDYTEHALGEGADAKAAAYVEARVNGGKTRWGVGLDANIVTASLRAVVSAVNRI